MTELVLAVSLAIGFSAMCSLFEAVLYAVPMGHVEAMAEAGKRTGRILRALRERVDRPIAAILSLNTIAHTVGAAWAGAAFMVLYGEEHLLLFSTVFTLAILLLSEVIPKTAGVVYCRGLAGPVARPLLAMVWVFRPLIWLTGQVTRLISRDQGFPGVSEEELLVMARLGRKEGAIDADEAAAIENILGLKEKTVRDIMTPRTVVFSLAVSSTLGQVRDSVQSLGHGRVPVYDADADDVVGTVHRQDLLAAMAEGRVGPRPGGDDASRGLRRRDPDRRPPAAPPAGEASAPGHGDRRVRQPGGSGHPRGRVRGDPGDRDRRRVRSRRGHARAGSPPAAAVPRAGSIVTAHPSRLS